MNTLKDQFVQVVARRLSETDPTAIATIARIVECMEPDRILRLIHRTESIQRNGGILIRSGARKRTKGGVFFWLAQLKRVGKLTKAQRKYCFSGRQQTGERQLAA